jgi:D-alanyl-D-alanine carboxypeptidase/D-alanyl-D-alanine-endopeptidase (penicillin-binding protein 4)
MNRLWIILFITLFQFESQAQLEFEKLPALEGASISYMVRDLWSGKLIAGYDTSRVLAPASVLKLFTTGLALHELGGTSAIKSTFYISGKVENGVLQGDLIFNGNFDPTLLASRYNRSLDKFTDQLLLNLKGNGIQSINGDIKIMDDDSHERTVPRTWIWEDIGNYYGAGSSRTVINENMLKIYLKSGEIGSVVEVLRTEPDLSWLVFDNKVTASKINRDLAYCFSRPGDKKILISGTIPANRTSFLVKASLPDPARTLAILLKNTLVEKGITVMGNSIVEMLSTDGLKVLFTINSPSIGSIVRKTNKHSVNVYAESLLNCTYLQHATSGMTRTDYMKESLSKYFNTKTMKLYDGSGLSRFNSVSSKQVVDLIGWMNKHEEKDAFYNSFSIAGESGTLRSLLANTIAKGKVKGKSGSMDGVRAYAGTINTRKGENLAFSVIVNNYDISNAALKSILEKWLWEIWSAN